MERDSDKLIIMSISRQDNNKNYGSKTSKKHKSQEGADGARRTSEFIYVDFEEPEGHPGGCGH